MTGGRFKTFLDSAFDILWYRNNVYVICCADSTEMMQTTFMVHFLIEAQQFRMPRIYQDKSILICIDATRTDLVSIVKLTH